MDDEVLTRKEAVIDVDGLWIESKHGPIRLLGNAYLAANGKYWCLADVGSWLCRVEVSIKEGLRL